MSWYEVVLKRLFYSLLLLLAVIVLNFFLIQLAPGDPADIIAGEMGATAEILAQIRATYGLDRPLHQQLLTYISKMVRGDFGFSFYFNKPVMELIAQRAGGTFLLFISSLLIAVFAGTVLGIIASRHPYSLFSNFITTFSLVGWSMPVFWSGLMLLILFGSLIPIFPVSGMYDVTLKGGYLARALDVLHHLFLPMTTLAIIWLALYSRLARASMLEVLRTDYVRAARAKGLSETTVVYKHALKNAVLPVVTMAGLQISHLFSGAVLVETVFNWPGLGRLFYESIMRRDHPTILGILFFSTFMVIVVNLITDFSYRLLDPRIDTRKK